MVSISIHATHKQRDQQTCVITLFVLQTYHQESEIVVTKVWPDKWEVPLQARDFNLQCLSTAQDPISASNMPNYVFSLAHFCEIHGPSIVICTQKSSTGTKNKASSKLQLCALCELVLPNDAVNIVSTVDEKEKYISTRYPSSQNLYTAYVKLVMKLLSVETSAESLKPVFFGDVVSGFCMSRVFKIQDVNSRGGERKYALIMGCDEEVHLLRNWDVVTTYMGEIILLIQRQVERNLAQEAEQLNVMDNERYLRRSKIRPKSLVELTNDTQIFVKIHLWAIDFLRDVLD